jgi:hypothetical protein
MYLLFYSPSPHPLQYQLPVEGVGPETHIHKITNVPVLGLALKHMYIKLPMYLFFIWRLD